MACRAINTGIFTLLPGAPLKHALLRAALADRLLTVLAAQHKNVQPCPSGQSWGGNSDVGQQWLGNAQVVATVEYDRCFQTTGVEGNFSVPFKQLRISDEPDIGRKRKGRNRPNGATGVCGGFFR